MNVASKGTHGVDTDGCWVIGRCPYAISIWLNNVVADD